MDTRFPLWLEYSGIPQLLAQSPRHGAAAWAILKKVAELDCAIHPQPEIVKITVQELADRTALTPTAVHFAARLLTRKKFLHTFLPEDDEEEACFKIHIPLKTPRTREQIIAAMPSPPKQLRYLDDYVDIAEPDAITTNDPLLREVVDLYFNTCSIAMNHFILDQLAFITRVYPPDAIRRGFKKAQQNQIRKLSEIRKEIQRLTPKRKETPHGKED